MSFGVFEVHHLVEHSGCFSETEELGHGHVLDFCESRDVGMMQETISALFLVWDAVVRTVESQTKQAV